jgi:hypothetical protein
VGAQTLRDFGALGIRAQPIDGPIRVKSVLGLALGLRLAVIWLFLSLHQPTWLYTRAPELACLASSLCNGRGFSSPFGGETGPSAFLAPGYPVIIAIIFRLFGDRSVASVFVILGLQTVFAVGTVFATMLIARSLFGIATTIGSAFTTVGTKLSSAV